MNAPAPISSRLEAGLATLTLAAPPGNRVSLAMLEQLAERLDTLAADDAVRAVLLTAEGPDFCHGANLADPRLAAAMLSGEGGRMEVAALGQRVVDRLATMPVPTVVGARGRILGAGACFFTVADFRCASPDASLRFPEVDRAMHLSWGILPRMVSAYGASLTHRLALLGDALDVRALPTGVVDVVDDPDAAARALAARLAAKPALAVRAIVATLRSGRTEDDARRFAETVASPDFVAAMRAFLGG